MNAINKNEVSMFKVGDKIIFAAMGNSVMEYQQCLEMFISQGLIRHATPEEIALGHRIESRNSQAISDCSLSNLCQNDTQNSLSIKQENQAIADLEILDYPEDYTSPLCKKYDERVK